MEGGFLGLAEVVDTLMPRIVGVLTLGGRWVHELGLEGFPTECVLSRSSFYFRTRIDYPGRLTTPPSWIFLSSESSVRVLSKSFLHLECSTSKDWSEPFS